MATELRVTATSLVAGDAALVNRSGAPQMVVLGEAATRGVGSSTGNLVEYSDYDATVGDLGTLTGAYNTSQGTAPYFDPALTATAARPSIASTRRVFWPSARAAVLALASGEFTPALSGAPTNIGNNDAFDAVSDIFAATLAANNTLENMTKVGGGAINGDDVGRTGRFVFTQDATGSRTLSLPAGTHYSLIGDDLGASDTLPILTAAASVTVVYFDIISTSLVYLFIAKPGA